MAAKTKSKIPFHLIIPLLLVTVLVFSAVKWYRASKTYEPTFELTMPSPEFYESLPPIDKSQPPVPPTSNPVRSRSESPAVAKPAELTDADWASIELAALASYAAEAESDRTGVYKSSQEEAQIRQIYHLVRAATEWRQTHGN